MAFTKRRRYTRRPYMRRRRPYRRTARIVRSRRSTQRRRQVHQYKRTCQKLQLAGSAPYAPLLSSFLFVANDVPNFSDFTGLYDQYKINMVILKFRLYNTPDAQAAGVNQSNYPTLYYARDYDDVTTPASLNEIRERGDCQQRILRADRYVYIKIKPKLLMPIYQPVSNTYAPIRSRPIDMTAIATPHYGLKWAIDNLANPNFLLTVEADYYFTCYGTR